LVAPDEVVEDSDFAVTVCDRETGKPVSGARVVFLEEEYTTDEKGKAGARGSGFRPGIVVSPFKEITEDMQGPAAFRYSDKDLRGEVKMATLFVEKVGKSADKDIAIKKGGGHKFGTFNRDGTNDRVYFSEPEDYPIQIYDRRGRKVKTLTETEGSWDGLDDNGNRVKMGIYIYQTNSGKSGTIFVRR
jgi:gliding motility-associated-like protein